MKMFAGNQGKFSLSEVVQSIFGAELHPVSRLFWKGFWTAGWRLLAHLRDNSTFPALFFARSISANILRVSDLKKVDIGGLAFRTSLPWWMKFHHDAARENCWWHFKLSAARWATLHDQGRVLTNQLWKSGGVLCLVAQCPPLLHS